LISQELPGTVAYLFTLGRAPRELLKENSLMIANLEDTDRMLTRRHEGKRLDVDRLAGPTNHICGLYDSRDVRDDMLVRFLREGLENGDKCVCFVGHPNELVERLALEQRLADGAVKQLDFQTADEAYLDNGAFCTEIMIDRLTRHVTAAMNDGYGLTRLVGDMSWVIRNQIDPRLVVAYEAQVNDFARRVPQIALCLYDISEFDGSVIVDVLRTHPRVYLNGMVVANPYYVASRAASAA